MRQRLRISALLRGGHCGPTSGDIIAPSSPAIMPDTKTIIERPESAKQLAQRDPSGRVNRTVQSLIGSFSPPSRSAGGELMGLWMLSFGDHGSAIVEAESIAHARLRVAVKGLIRASLFVGGCQIDPEFIPLIPNESIGRKLTREHTSGLLELLKHGPPRREVIGPPVQMLATSTARRPSCSPEHGRAPCR
jgi:hypothetical protein